MNKNYRKLYKEHFNIEFNNKMSIHHIDFNRNNNSIKNLLLLPLPLHQRFHMSVQCLRGNLGTMTDPKLPDFVYGIVPDHNIKMTITYFNSLLEINQWIRHKAEGYYYCYDPNIKLISK